MLERIILVVDDNAHTADVHFPVYQSEIDRLKNKSEKWGTYTFQLIHMSTMKDAIGYLSDASNIVDVLVVDYDFNGEATFSNGTTFVKHVRGNINRYCQIVFYTMQGLSNIDKDELIDLINSDVYKIVDKSDNPKEMGRRLFEAATLRNQVVESLEHFFVKYRTMLSTYQYTLGGNELSVEEIINHIRMDDDLGRIFIEKLLQKAILLDTDIEG